MGEINNTIIDETERFSNMIQAFECDFVLARDERRTLASLDLNNKSINRDIDLLEELSYLLRYGKAKIIVDRTGEK